MQSKDLQTHAFGKLKPKEYELHVFFFFPEKILKISKKLLFLTLGKYRHLLKEKKEFAKKKDRLTVLVQIHVFSLGQN